MRLTLFALAVGGLFVFASQFLKRAHRLEQTPYEPMIGPRKYIVGMEAPDSRYDPISATAALRMAEQIKMIQLGIPPQPTESSIELARAYQRAERRHANLDEETGTPLRVH